MTTFVQVKESILLLLSDDAKTVFLAKQLPPYQKEPADKLPLTEQDYEKLRHNLLEWKLDNVREDFIVLKRDNKTIQLPLPQRPKIDVNAALDNNTMPSSGSIFHAPIKWKIALRRF